jgi:hypothetical protein
MLRPEDIIRKPTERALPAPQTQCTCPTPRSVTTFFVVNMRPLTSPLSAECPVHGKLITVLGEVSAEELGWRW